MQKAQAANVMNNNRLLQYYFYIFIILRSVVSEGKDKDQHLFRALDLSPGLSTSTLIVLEDN